MGNILQSRRIFTGSSSGATSPLDITVVANYSALPPANTQSGKFFWCEASQGTWWLPGSLGGTYYNKGLYYSNGTIWESIETPYQATLADVDAGLITDQFVSPFTLQKAAQWTTKFDIPTGNSSQYLDGAGVPQNFPTSLPPSGTAGGDLTGSYPNPTVHRVHGKDFQSGNPQNLDVWIFESSPDKWQHRNLDKSDVGLGNVDNTSDANKPISSATQTALNAKQDTLVSGTNIKSVNNQSLVGSGNVNIGYSSSQVGSWAHVGNTTMTKVLTLPAVPANTFAANDHITIKIAAVSATANASNRVAVYVNTSDSLTGAILVAHFLSNGSTTHTVGERTMFIQVSNGSGVGTFAWTTTLFVQTDNNTVTPAFTTMAIDWTQQQFFIIALQNGTTVLTQTVRAFGIQKR